MRLMNLFFAFFKVGLLSFGGGYTLIPLIEYQVVKEYSWLTQEEFLQILGVSQAIPGAISIKFATYTGYKVAGVLGVVATIVGSLIVPVAAVLILFRILTLAEDLPIANRFLKGIKAATWGIIIGFGVDSLLKTQMDIKNILVGIAAIVAIAFFKINPAFIVIGAGIAGVVLFK